MRPLHIVIGFVVGILLGAFVAPHAPWLVTYLARPAGDIFLRLLLAMVMPLAVSALVLAVVELPTGVAGGLARRLLTLTLGLTGVAVALGVGTVTLFAPGRGVDRAGLPAGSVTAAVTGDPVDALVKMVPSNIFTAAAQGELLGVLVIALLLGFALRTLPDAAPKRAVRDLAQGIHDLCGAGVQLVLRIAPLGVAGLATVLVARTGMAGLLPLARFVGVALLALGTQCFVVYPLALRFLGKRDPLAFFRAIQPAMAMAFATSSSAATLPMSLRVATDRLGLPAERARFVLTVGATGNQNGTALFEGLAVLFLAQLYGVELGLARQALVVGISVLAGIGTAGVPGGSLPVIAAVCAAVGVPAEGVGVLVGVDRLLDMCRTTLNVTGDLVIAAIVAEDAAGDGEAGGVA